jgi:hypothetical protein
VVLDDDDDDGADATVSTVWPGADSWTGPIEIRYHEGFVGEDVHFTLPRSAYHSDTLDGRGIEVSIPLGALQHVMERFDAASQENAVVNRAIMLMPTAQPDS